MKNILFTVWFIAGAFVLNASAQVTKRYDLYVRDTVLNIANKKVKAYAVNGQFPMPELHFTEGDTALIVVHNELNTETSLHWHGLLLPNEQDGVPYLTTAPIKAKSTHVYKFPLLQNGTYWYHSHTALQEQHGMYGAFIIHKRNIKPIKEQTVLLSDWTNMDAMQVHRRLHNANDWSAIKKAAIQKGAVQSYADAIRVNKFNVKLENEWKRMLAMDVSDVYYDKFLINGLNSTENKTIRAGDTIRLRVINGSASTYFWLNTAAGKIRVVASDGMEVEPVEVDRLIIAVSETYDLEIIVPESNKSFEFRATSEDRIGYTSLWLGEGTKIYAEPLQALNYFEGMKMMNDMMLMNGDMNDMGMQMSLQQMDMNMVMYPEGASKKTLNYAMLKSPSKTTLPAASTRTLQFELTGNMNRYVWSINNKTVSESDKILIKKGENIRIIIYNNSMMRHPMHLHGHFFRVINGQGDYAPLKNVLDIMPMETDTIEFSASESGDWYFHCHILYHMMSGMGRIFTYENSPANPQLPDKEKALKQVYKDDKEYHFMFENDFASNGLDGEAMLQNTRWRFQSEWRIGYTAKHGYEVETHFGRYIGRMQWLYPYIGLDNRSRSHTSTESEKNLFSLNSTKDQRNVLCLGLQYTLPMLVNADLRIDQTGNIRLQFMREDIPLSKRLRLSAMYNSDFEYMAGLKYVLNQSFAISSHYDSDMGFGIGFSFLY